MKKVLTILTCIFFLASGLHLSIDRHYCSGVLAATRISLTGEKASCGMEQADFPNTLQCVIGTRCCTDLMSWLKISSNFFPEQFKPDKPLPVHQILTFQNLVNHERVAPGTGSSTFVLPPGENIPDGMSQSFLCLLRI